MKGDRVEVIVDTGQGVQRFEIAATRAGRRVEVTTGRGIVEVTEVTRSGTPVRSGRFMASRLVALVEHPALEGDERLAFGRRRRERRSPAPGVDQLGFEGILGEAGSGAPQGATDAGDPSNERGATGSSAARRRGGIDRAAASTPDADAGGGHGVSPSTPRADPGGTAGVSPSMPRRG